MIGKVLFTLGVILVVMLIWRTRQAVPDQRQLPPRLVNPPTARRRGLLALAVAAAVLMLAASGMLLYDYWRDNNEVIVVRVIDARSGRAAEYRAQRGEIRDREFVTTDGRHVVLAETERLETSILSTPVPPDRN
ncbi:MAG: hypothetical protein KDI88_03820 [Gammaproteobacteria bacterium]|nr:hypothetical protein [Gammaproteobacteria bacterium]